MSYLSALSSAVISGYLACCTLFSCFSSDLILNLADLISLLSVLAKLTASDSSSFIRKSVIGNLLHTFLFGRREWNLDSASDNLEEICNFFALASANLADDLLNSLPGALPLSTLISIRFVIS